MLKTSQVLVDSMLMEQESHLACSIALCIPLPSKSLILFLFVDSGPHQYQKKLDLRQKESTSSLPIVSA